MQVKIVIGTISFMLTMIVLGFAALLEPARMERYASAEAGRSIETGAKIYDGQCATCHGVNGQALECYDATGEQIGCQGLPLNNAQFLCGDSSARMDAMSWEGTKEDFVYNTVAAGRLGRGMPTWSERYGGPMRDDQVGDVVSFVLNWEHEALCAVPTPTPFPWPETVDDYLASVDAGDAVNGAELYSITYGCNACHGLPDEPGSANVGPWMGDIAERGGSIVEGASAAQYLYRSILYPSEHISAECPSGPCVGPPSVMPANFIDRMGASPQDMADILVYLLGE